MAKQNKKGYFYQGNFIIENSTEDLSLRQEFKGTLVSKTDLKKQSTQLQATGQELLELSEAQLDKINLPENLSQAINEAKQIKNFEARRRQMQFIGKLMRQLEPEEITRLKQAIQNAKSGILQQTQQLHLIEQWRERLINEQLAISQWFEQYPNSDLQSIRSLVRQIRKEQTQQPTNLDKGLSPRQSKSFRSLFKILQQQIEQSSTGDN